MFSDRDLRRLAQLYRVQTFYTDGFGRLRLPPPEALLQTLRELGAPAERMTDLRDAIRSRRQFLWSRAVEPVLVVWNGNPAALTLRLPLDLAGEPVHYRIRLEEGDLLEGIFTRAVWSRAKETTIEGARYVARRVELPGQLPPGYHRLSLQVREQRFDVLVISAPERAPLPPGLEPKSWGIFLPLYSLTSQRSWGSGDFSDLESLGDWAVGLGGRVVGTLPLLAAFLDAPFDPSPYSPVTRLAWNEFYVDVTRVPELERCAAARALLDSADFRDELGKLRPLDLVNYRSQMSLKRKILEALARCLTTGEGRRDALRQFADSHPQVEEYARFRAALEKKQMPWSLWSEAARKVLGAGDYDDQVKEYYLYAQWLAHEQIERAAEKLRARGGVLYLDFPLGVHRDGFDTWREQRVFAFGASGGAPPDAFFTKGQNWGFPPLHPERLREEGYGYWIASLRHHFQCARMLRIDHVMGLHRLFWIPQGLGPSDGVYVHYPAEEFYAILILESYRHQALIVGENLGTVPSYVNRAMAAHGIRGMHVGQFGIDVDPEQALKEIPAGTVTSLNTHDTPTFASFWAGDDIQDRIELGLLDEAGAAEERRNRCAQRESLVAFLNSRGWLKETTPDPGAVLTAWLNYLASGPIDLLLLNLEDLWLEKLSQNVPGTGQERPNWRRKARYGLEEFGRMEPVLNRLRAVDDQRKKSR